MSPDARELRRAFDTAAAFGQVVFAARQKRNLTQVELADLSGVPKLEVRRLEHGMVVPTTRTLIDLAEALGVELRFVVLSEDATAANRDVVSLHRRRGLRAPHSSVRHDGWDQSTGFE